MQNVEVEEEHGDERSVDDLLSFINGGNGGVCGHCFYCILFWQCLLQLLFIWFNVHNKFSSPGTFELLSK